MKRLSRLTALLLALMLLVCSAAQAEVGIQKEDLDLAGYNSLLAGVQTYGLTDGGYEYYIRQLSAQDVDARYETLSRWHESWLGTVFYADFIEYYKANYPGGDLLCTCAAPAPYNTLDHASDCAWNALNLIPEGGTTLEAASGSTEISVAGNIPAGVELLVESAQLSEIEAYVPELAGFENPYKMFDISLMQKSRTAEWQPGEGEKVAVTMDVSDIGSNGDHVMVYHVHVNEDNTSTNEVLGPIIIREGKIAFEMSRFSYVIVMNSSSTISNVTNFYPVQSYVDDKKFPIAGNGYWCIVGVYIGADRTTHIILGQVGNGNFQTNKIDYVTVDGDIYKNTNNSSLLNYKNEGVTQIKFGESAQTAETVIDFSPTNVGSLLGFLDINLGSGITIGETFDLSLRATTGQEGNSFNIAGVKVELHLEYSVAKTVSAVNSAEKNSESEVVSAGDWVTFKFVVTNGSGSNTNIKEAALRDDLPACFDISTVQWSTDGANWRNTEPVIPEITPGNSAVYFLKAQVAGNWSVAEDTTYINTVYLDIPNQVTATDTANVVIEAPKKGSLTITKRDLNQHTYAATSEYSDYESAIFTVSGDYDGDGENDIFTVVIPCPKGSGSVTLTGLRVGEYKVTEQTGWTWRYMGEADKYVVVPGGGSASVVFTNQHNNQKWLGGDNYATNVFGKSN